MILERAVADYLASLHAAADPVLAEMREHGRRDGIPIVVPETGALLELLARATGAERAVEVGTAIGVSTLHLARGGAHVTSFEIDAGRHEAAKDYLARAGLSDRVDLRLQDATEGLAELTGQFDLAFIDGPKQEYGSHLDRVVELVRPGGLIAVDNVLMGGTVATGQPDQIWSADRISTVRDLNDRLMNDPALTATVTPVGDGLALAVRR
jgi:caffeoyl-CoA O-methyltransferase